MVTAGNRPLIASPAPDLAMDSVTVQLGRPSRRVLDAVSLDVFAGEVFGLVGANGAGKTTLVRAALDMVDVEPGGSIVLRGRPHRTRGARDGVAYLPERFMPSPVLSGRAFLAFVARLDGLGLTRADLVSLAEEFALDPDALERRVEHYSKGMVQKLGLMATFVADPAFVILDEPMTGLDPGSRAALRTALARRSAAGTTVLMNSHLLSDVEQTCRRIAILDGGRIRFVGTPAKLIRDTGARDLEAAFIHAVGRPRDIADAEH